MEQKTANHHDIGYKEIFSYLEMVQQLIEGFAPKEVADLLDFSTLKPHPGHYITPTFQNKEEDIVWSVKAQLEPAGEPVEIYLYILLEFQSSVDRTMPVRFMQYIASFYDHLLKNDQVKSSEYLPPVFPIVLYNGNPKWYAKTNITDMIHPVPDILKPYQPNLSYYLIDEGRYTEEQLEQIHTPISAVFSLENATDDQKMAQAILRASKIIQLQQGERREVINKVLTRWLKRHLQRLGLGLNIDSIQRLAEEESMLAENLENWKEGLVQKGKMEGIQEGIQKGKMEGLLEGKITFARGIILARFKEAQASEVDALLAQADEKTLDQIKEKIFVVQSVEELFK